MKPRKGRGTGELLIPFGDEQPAIRKAGSAPDTGRAEGQLWQMAVRGAFPCSPAWASSL